MSNKKFRSFIVINGEEAEIIESNGRRFFTHVIDRDLIPSFCATVLENCCCPYLLPMYFIHGSDKLCGYYDFGGYIQLKNAFETWKNRRKNIASEIVEVMIAVVRAVISAENHLFEYSSSVINTDTIFIRINTGEVKLAYIPEKESRYLISDKLLSLITDTAKIACDEQWDIYADEMTEWIISCNESVSGIEKKLLEKGREICGYQWPQKEELRALDHEV